MHTASYPRYLALHRTRIIKGRTDAGCRSGTSASLYAPTAVRSACFWYDHGSAILGLLCTECKIAQLRLAVGGAVGLSIHLRKTLCSKSAYDPILASLVPMPMCVSYIRSPDFARSSASTGRGYCHAYGASAAQYSLTYWYL